MATTFDVYPRSAEIPSFQDILDLSTQRLRERLKELKIDVAPAIQANLYSTNPDRAKSIDMRTPARWEESEYAWFFIDPVPGGTDAYFRLVDQLDREAWADQNSNDHPLLQKRAVIRACLDNGHYWYFRRSAGQPAMINLAYGLIAASVAELTNGLIYSDDGAWDYERFPATPEEFYTWYFRPEMAIEPDTKEWTEHNISHLAEDLTA